MRGVRQSPSPAKGTVPLGYGEDRKAHRDYLALGARPAPAGDPAKPGTVPVTRAPGEFGRESCPATGGHLT